MKNAQARITNAAALDELLAMLNDISKDANQKILTAQENGDVETDEQQEAQRVRYRQYLTYTKEYSTLHGVCRLVEEIIPGKERQARIVIGMYLVVVRARIADMLEQIKTETDMDTVVTDSAELAAYKHIEERAAGLFAAMRD